MVTFEEAVGIVSKRLGYDTESATDALMGAMDRGEIRTSTTHVTKTGANELTVITGLPSTRKQSIHKEDLTRFIASRESLLSGQFGNNLGQSLDTSALLEAQPPNSSSGQVQRTDQVDERAVDTDDSVGSFHTGADGQPSLRDGRNSAEAIQRWVVWQARNLVEAKDTKNKLAERIRLLAEQWRYESERGPQTIPSIVRMLPAGITGGRGKNGSRSKNRPKLIYGKGESKARGKVEK